jgi:hypothetical protein
MQHEIEEMDEMREAYENMPKRFEQLAAVVQGTGRNTWIGVARPVILRLPETVLAELDALATMAGKSRNSMAINLIDAAIQELRESLDKNARGKLDLTTLQNHVALNSNLADRETGEF